MKMYKKLHVISLDYCRFNKNHLSRLDRCRTHALFLRPNLKLNSFKVYVELVHSILWILKLQAICWICSTYMLNYYSKYILNFVHRIRWISSISSPYTLNLFNIYVELPPRHNSKYSVKKFTVYVEFVQCIRWIAAQAQFKVYREVVHRIRWIFHWSLLPLPPSAVKTRDMVY